MTIDADTRATIATAFRDAMPTIEAAVHLYCARVEAPERFALGIYDASATGADYLTAGDADARVIAEHSIRTADWGERNYHETARRKLKPALRTGRDSGDLVRHAKELFQEGDMTSPGACLSELAGQPVCVATSGLRGPEDEIFALLTIELMRRLLTPPS